MEVQVKVPPGGDQHDTAQSQHQSGPERRPKPRLQPELPQYRRHNGRRRHDNGHIRRRGIIQRAVFQHLVKRRSRQAQEEEQPLIPLGDLIHPGVHAPEDNVRQKEPKILYLQGRKIAQQILGRHERGAPHYNGDSRQKVT